MVKHVRGDRDDEIDALAASGLGGVVEGAKRLADDGTWAMFLARERVSGAGVFLNVRSRRDLDDRTVGDVLDAAARTRGIDHPSVLAVRQFGLVGDFLWVTTDAYRGRLVASATGASTPRDRSACLELLRQVAVPLEAIHRAGLVHGALSGFSFQRDTDGRVRIRNLCIDTPILRANLAAGVETEACAYAAHEVRKGWKPGPASDQHALAAMLLRMLTGPRLSQEGVPEAMRAPLRRALSARPAERFPSVLALWEELDPEFFFAPPAAPTPGPVAPAPVPQPAPAQLSRGVFAVPRSAADPRSEPHVLHRDDDPESESAGVWSRALGVALLLLLLSGSAERLVERAWRGSESASPPVPPILAEPEPAPGAPGEPTARAQPAPERERPSPRPEARDSTDEPALPEDAAPPVQESRPAPRARPERRRTPVGPTASAFPTPAPAPTPVEVQEPGTLSVQAYPWGVVYLDDVHLGNTPLLGVTVPAGSHDIRVERPGYQTYFGEVTIDPGRDTRVTGIVLSEGTR